MTGPPPSEPARAKRGTLVNEFSWSVSRHRVFGECLRKYYFRHYGSWGGWEEDADPRVREIYVLKQLSNRFLFAGNVVHAVLAEVLDKHRYGREVGEEEARDAAYRRLAEGFRESREGAYRRRKAVGLFEHEYDEEIPDAVWARMRDRVFQCLENFYASRVRRTILDTAVEDWLPIDAVDSFGFEGTRVYVAPDFALRNRRGNALLIDWKTGRPGEPEDKHQMVCYGLFAQAKWDVAPQRAIGELHYLRRRDLVHVVTLEPEALEAGKEAVRESIRLMKERLEDPVRNVAAEERFPKTDDRVLCQRCGFRKVCWPEWPVLEGEARG